MSSLVQIGSALSGAALPVAYGPCRVRGNNLVNNQLADNSRVALYILGEGPWDGLDRLWINSKLVNIADTTLVHFHNGFDGTLGAGLAPSSNGGDQLVDNFWSLLPSNFQPTTFSRRAYLMVHAKPDPQAPSNTLDVVGDYRTMRVRQFDSSGNQTTFAYTQNPAWMILDVILRQMLNREWLVSSASAAGGDLTAAQKARIDWSAWAESAAWCDTILGNGQKRFECGLAFPNTTSLQQAISQLCTLSQTYLIETWGQISLRPDQPRASTFTLTSDHITAGSFKANKTDLRASPNRFNATFNDLLAQQSCAIDTAANTGLSRTGNVLTVKVPVGQTHPFLVGDNVDIVNPDDASFAGTITVTVVVDTRTFKGNQTGANATSGDGYCGTTESRFAQRTDVVDHENHQLAVGQRGVGLAPVLKRVPQAIDLGNNTMERAQRILKFISTRTLGVDATPYAAPFSATVQASMYAVDGAGNALVAQEDGDVITIDSTISEEYQGDYEIMSHKITRPNADPTANVGSDSPSSSADQSSQSAVIDLTIKRYLPAAFSDASDVAQPLVASSARITPFSGLLLNQLVGGTVGNRLSSGRNIASNSGFEVNTSTVAPGTVVTGVGDALQDDWFCFENDSGSFELLQESTFAPHTGKYNLLIRLLQNLNVAAGASVFGIACNPIIPAVPSAQLWITGFLRWDSNAALPSGCTGDVFVGVRFYDLNGAYISEALAGVAANSATWNQYTLAATVPSNCATMQVECTAGIHNTGVGNGEFNTGANLYMDARFDDLNIVFVTSTDNEIADGTGTPLAGGKRGAIALDTNNRLAGTFRNNAVNSFVNLDPPVVLSQSGTSTTILVSASTGHFGDGNVSYNSGSNNTGVYNTFFVYADDPTFAGGALSYTATQQQRDLTSSNGRLYFGEQQLLSGGGGTSGGGGGGGKGSF